MGSEMCIRDRISPLECISRSGAIYGTGAACAAADHLPLREARFHQPHALRVSSFLATVEKRFNLKPLTTRDAQANSMVDSFDFTQTPLLPLILTTPPLCP